MTDIDLDAIRARAEAATAGPWHAWDRGIGFEVHIGAECFADVYESEEQCWELNSGMRETFEPTDAEFIAHARTDVPALIAEVERLRAENVRALATVKRLETEFPCDGGCSPETGGPQEDCSLHGRSPRELWQIFGELQQQRDDVRAENDTLKKRVAAYYYALGVIAKPRTTIGGDVA